MSAVLDGPRFNPRSGAPQSLVVLLHGYGSNGDDLISLAPAFAERLPHTVFVSPHAPDPVPGAPGGRQWFPLARLSPDELAVGVVRAGPILQRFLDQELTRYRLPPHRLALVGFSQGTMMALHAGLRRPDRIGGILGYSGALAAPETLKAELASKPPVQLIHGDADTVVPAQALFTAAHALSEAGHGAMWSLRPGLPHGIDPEGVALGGWFLSRALTGGF
ncbi:MAG: alpha/beta hydrolase [Maricaulaceae bacterium]